MTKILGERARRSVTMLLVLLHGCGVGGVCCFSSIGDRAGVTRGERIRTSTLRDGSCQSQERYIGPSISSSSKWYDKKSSTLLRVHRWDGDDIRWSSKIRRRLRRSELRMDQNRCKVTLIAVNIAFFMYQFLTTVEYLRRKYPSYWPNNAGEIIVDALWGGSVLGPLARTFGFSAALSHSQPFRYLTSAFFHSGLLPLIVNMDILRRQPSWLEAGLGAGLYLTTFLASIVVGNFTQLSTAAGAWDPTIYLGVSSGVAGLFGLMFLCLLRMGSSGRGSGQILRGMGVLLFLGMWVDHVSSPSIIGGFVSGICIGILCGPRYVPDYAMRRSNSVEFDPAPRDYRRAMGFGVAPTRRGLLSLKVFWAVIFGVMLSNPKFRSMPALAIHGLLHPFKLLS